MQINIVVIEIVNNIFVNEAANIQDRINPEIQGEF